MTRPTGDERPCQRCIKRGLQDACHDGVRKKAKYLHDAPNDALMPGAGLRAVDSNQFQFVTNLARGQHLPPDQGFTGSSSNEVYVQQQGAQLGFGVYPPSGAQSQMPPPLSDSMMNQQAFNSQQSPISQHFSVGPSQMSNIANALQPTTQAIPSSMPDSFGGSPFDSSESLQYNFDPASFNFGNHYGALEFGMLGHMSSGAAETPPSDNAAQLNPSNNASYTTPATTISTAYSGSPVNGTSYVFPQGQGLGEWRNDTQGNVRPGSGLSLYNNTRGQDPNVFVKQEGPHAYAIGAGTSNFTSPSSTHSPQDILPSFKESPTTSNLYTASRQSMQDRSTPQRKGPSMISSSNLHGQVLTAARRSRNPSTIYESVKQPYPYTSAFHGLTAFLQKRFSPQKTLRIAKALASIRPSFISSTKDLTREDLIFMEKCFQRTLWEFEGFINSGGTPTIVCRRTGEVAAVGKEFSILTGWKQDILLGKEPNLNANTGGTSGNPGTGASSKGGFNTPRIPEGGKYEFTDGSRPQPVYLAELLDDESAVEFYEDFARLAFGDSRGSVMTHCKLLKYRTKDQVAIPAMEAEEDFDNKIGSRLKHKRQGHYGNKVSASGESGTYQLGEKDGKVECCYCWTVKRDVFDIPMLIIMNVCDLILVLTFPLLLIAIVLTLHMNPASFTYLWIA